MSLTPADEEIKWVEFPSGHKLPLCHRELPETVCWGWWPQPAAAWFADWKYGSLSLQNLSPSRTAQAGEERGNKGKERKGEEREWVERTYNIRDLEPETNTWGNEREEREKRGKKRFYIAILFRSRVQSGRCREREILGGNEWIERMNYNIRCTILPLFRVRVKEVRGGHRKDMDRRWAELIEERWGGGGWDWNLTKAREMFSFVHRLSLSIWECSGKETKHFSLSVHAGSVTVAWWNQPDRCFEVE